MGKRESGGAARGEDGRFKTIFDFCTRVDPRAVNRKALESLVRAGAFDSLGCRRSQLYAVIGTAGGPLGATATLRCGCRPNFD